MKRAPSPHRLWSCLSLLALALGACAPAVAPEEARPGATAPAHVSAPFDVQAVIRRVHFAFRQEGRDFTADHDTHAVRVDPEGALRFTPHQPAAGPGEAIEGAPLTLRTVALSRGGSLMKEARASVRDDGALALARGPVVEVLRNGEEGVEQSWELAAKPAGAGDLEVRVELAGLEYAGRTAHGHHFVDARTGLGVRYGNATWVDADGVRTGVLPVYEGGALVMRVPSSVVEGSAYPAVLDPLISPESGIDTPPYRPAANAQWSPAIAFGGDSYLVAWRDLRSGGYDAIYAARVRASDGVVLDKKGISVSSALGAKEHPAVAFDGTNFLVVWDDARNGNYDIYGARVRASDGVVLEATGLAISRPSGAQTSPAVAFDGTHYLIVWQDGRYSGTYGYDIFGARLRASDGVLLDTSGLAISMRANNQRVPSVSAGGGSFLVAWQDDRGGIGDIYGTRVRSSDGAVLDTANGFAISTAAGTQDEPDLVFDGTNHFVVWQDYRNGNADIYGARVRPSDRSVLDLSGLALSTAAGTQSAPEVTLAGTHYLVVWQDHRSGTNADVYGARVRVSDRLVLDPTGLALSVGAKAETSPAVASDGTHAYVAWSDDRSSAASDIYGTRVQLTDGALLEGTGVAIATNITSHANPAIAAGGDGYLVVWSESQTSGGHDLYGARVRGSDGALLDPSGIAISTRSTDEKVPAVAFDGTNFLVVWQDYRGGTTSDVYGARVRALDGVVLDPDGLALTTAVQNQEQPAVASNGSSHLVIWKDSRSSTAGDIYGTLVQASDGTRLATDVHISNNTTGYDDFPAVASDGVDYLAVWRSLWSVGTIKGARVAGSTGAVLATNLDISAGGPAASYPAVAYGGGVYLATWTGTPTSGDGNIYAARVAPLEGTVLDIPSLAVNTLTGNQDLPRVAFDGGHFLVTWRTTQNLSATRLSPAGTLVDGSGYVLATGNTSAPLASYAPGHFMSVFIRNDAALGVTRTKALFVTYGADGTACASASDCRGGLCVDGLCASAPQ